MTSSLWAMTSDAECVAFMTSVEDGGGGVGGESEGRGWGGGGGGGGGEVKI